VSFDEILRGEKRAEQLLTQELRRAMLDSMYDDVLTFIAEHENTANSLTKLVDMLTKNGRNYEQFKNDLGIIRDQDLAAYDIPGPSSGQVSKIDMIRRWLNNAEGAMNQKQLENLVKSANPRWSMGEGVRREVDKIEAGLERAGGR
jgi:hypothetical protein